MRDSHFFYVIKSYSQVFTIAKENRCLRACVKKKHVVRFTTVRINITEKPSWAQQRVVPEISLAPALIALLNSGET